MQTDEYPVEIDVEALPGAARRTHVTVDGDDAPQGGGSLTGLPERYEALRLLGTGGFGEVHRVLDRKLGRVVAMKTLLAGPQASSELRARFVAESRLTAWLSHPGIVAVHDSGELPDGRLWYTMLEVRGRTLRAVIDAQGTDPTATRARLLEAFARVCETMGYAHSRGVIHRDLKPENIMIGEFGQIVVMDWGLARRVHEPEGPAAAESGHAEAPSEPTMTRRGDVIGTPAYMPPEQARGEVEQHGPPADVYALGAILFHILAGHPPDADRPRPDLGLDAQRVAGDASGVQVQSVARRMAAAGEAPRALVTKADLPPDFLAICRRAMAEAPSDRYEDAGLLAADVRAVLQGTRRRQRARKALAQAMEALPRIHALQARADALRAESRALLSALPSVTPVATKAPAWQCEDEAERHDTERAVLETRWLQGVHGALMVDAELPEAHAALADHYRDKLLEAERSLLTGEAVRYEEMLRAHDRGEHRALLRGTGAVTLVTDPPGAAVTLHRYEYSGRRLVAVRVGELGTTPLVEAPLDRGSYLLEIHAPGRHTVKYPVLIERATHWDGCRPGGTTPYAIPLPRESEIDDDEVYVPAGYAWIGGDPRAGDSLPQQRVWIDAFVAGRFPVTNAEYLAFLNDLVANGREEEALAACPRANRGTLSDADDTLAYARERDGRFGLKPHDEGEVWRMRGPAVLMTWVGAMAYAHWRAERSGRAYRLLHELEREKAARGVDRRFFPWGNHFDPAWARVATSVREAASRADVDEYPTDESVYGLRQGAGNSRDFCLNLWTAEGPVLENGCIRIEAPPLEGEAYRAVRGGAWSSVEDHSRLAGRFANRPSERRSVTGLRVARSFAALSGLRRDER